VSAPAQIWAAAAALCLALSSCGDDLPPAAEPADAPPLARPPAGDLFEVGKRPEGIAVDPATGLIAVGLHGDNRIVLVRARSGRVVRRLSVPATSRHLSLARRGGPVLAAAEAADDLLLVDLPEGTISAVPVGEHPHDATSADRLKFVSDEFGDTVSVVNGSRVVATLAAPRQPGGIATSGDRVALVAVRQRVLRVYDATTLRPLGDAPAGVGPTHVVATRGRAFVADTEGGRILQFRLGRNPKQVGSVAAPGAPYGMALDSRRRFLWITLTAPNRAVVYRVGSGRLRRIASYPTVRQPNSVAVDPRSGAAWITGSAGDRIERLAPPSQAGHR
jgi:DNA-binding beta-propeller fold protein YncE